MNVFISFLEDSPYLKNKLYHLVKKYVNVLEYNYLILTNMNWYNEECQKVLFG
jgi:hypothetical protein